MIISVPINVKVGSNVTALINLCHDENENMIVSDDDRLYNSTIYGDADRFNIHELVN